MTPLGVQWFVLWRWCCTVVVGDDRPCLPRTSFTLGSSRGYISSAVADTTQRGSTQCPWVIEARRGQRVNVTLWDFGSGGSVVPLPAAVDDLAQTCQAYAVIRERAPARSFTVRETIIRRFLYFVFNFNG